MDLVAERVFEFWEEGAEQPSAVRVLVGRPAQEASGPDWAAPYEIHGPGPEEVRRYHAMGVDAMQALILALQILPVWLAGIQSRGRVTWLGSEAPDLGFDGLVSLGRGGGVPDTATGVPAP
jgi:hypothetical protein